MYTEAPDYLALQQVCLAKVRGGYRPALGMSPCVLDYGSPPRSHLHTPRKGGNVKDWLSLSVWGLGATMFPSAGPDLVTGSGTDGTLYVIMQWNPSGIDNRNPTLESASFNSSIIFPGFQLQSQGGRWRTWGLFMWGKRGLRLTMQRLCLCASHLPHWMFPSVHEHPPSNSIPLPTSQRCSGK